MLGSGLAASRLVPGRRCEVSGARASRAYSARVEKRPGERTSLCAQAAGVDSPSASRATEQPGRPKGGSSGPARSHETDVVVIGAGIGGLSCGAILASYGLKVTVVESHSIPGGAAHAWVRDGYHFESGPSLYSGMGGKGMEANPMAHVFQAIGEDLELKKYDAWNVFFPEGQYLTKVGLDNFHEILMDVRGPEASQQWRELQELMRPLAEASTLIPPAAFRGDAGVAVTAIGRYLPRLFSERGRAAAKLAGPFSDIIKDKITDKFILNYLDLLCFLLSGLPANGTIAAEVAFMFNEWYRPNACLEFPVGGSQAMVDTLVRGLRKHGGQLYLSSHVNEIVVEGGRAAGVKLRNGSFVKARKAVVSNAFLNTTQKMLPPGAVPASWAKQADTTPLNRSFMHLHLGFDATGLEDLELHHIVVNSWEPCVDSEQNVVLISIASVMDPSLAPAGKHTLHAYLPATEPYDIWDGLDRSSSEYKQLKEERSQVLWKAVERVIPDIRNRVEVSMVGTPLTHERFLRRHRGTYGPGIIAGQASFPGHTTPVPGLYMCGDSTFPGIGLPAVAASGAIAANTLVPIWEHWKMLDRLGV